jgi:hypothetical protein
MPLFDILKIFLLRVVFTYFEKQELKENEYKYTKDIWNFPSLKQDLNIDVQFLKRLEYVNIYIL